MSARFSVGVNPVREALRAHRPLDKVLIAKGASGPRMQEIIDLCREHSIPVRFESREALDRVSKGVPHQGVVAFGAAHNYIELDDVLKGAALLVILDGVEDPHNLGAIIRTAHAAGANAVVVPERRAAPLTETVDKAAAGALEYLPVVRVTNVSQSIERLKQQGFWIYGLDEHGTQIYDQVQFSVPTAIVLGGEGKGLHQGVQKHCDVLVRIPMSGAVSSLNVSVAAGVVLFEWRRRQAPTPHSKPRDNSAMQPNLINAPPPIEQEIAAGLEVLKKNGGYRATADEGPSGDLSVRFQFGENEQTLKFSRDEWQTPGSVKERVIQDLDI